jgi:hypothetical protein
MSRRIRIELVNDITNDTWVKEIDSEGAIYWIKGATSTGWNVVGIKEMPIYHS